MYEVRKYYPEDEKIARLFWKNNRCLQKKPNLCV